MNVEVHHGLASGLSVRLDDVEAVWLHRESHCVRCSPSRHGKPTRQCFVHRPDIGYVTPWNHEDVAKDGGLQRKERDDVCVAIDLASIRVVPSDYFAERTVRVRNACRHLGPMSGGWP
jgi:hypothetical protein